MRLEILLGHGTSCGASAVGQAANLGEGTSSFQSLFNKVAYSYFTDVVQKKKRNSVQMNWAALEFLAVVV